jgi:hypothetical protein
LVLVGLARGVVHDADIHGLADRDTDDFTGAVVDQA